MAKRVADIVVETLQAAGVKHCWGVPGDTLNFVTDAIRRSGIEWVHVRHEEVAGFAAGAEAMLTGDLTACAGSCGPGSLHFINGLFESHRNRAPVVLIASQITSDEIGFDFPQEVDYAPIYKSCSVFCDEIRTPAQARRKTAMAAQAALSKRGVRRADLADRRLQGPRPGRTRLCGARLAAGDPSRRRRSRPHRGSAERRRTNCDLWWVGMSGRP
jgi:pyruvate dehydrogenase (quinone)